jgi:hypothetical protein
VKFKLYFVVPALAIAALSACYGDAVSSGASIADAVHAPAPATIADRTVLDEKAVLGAELAYQAFRTAAELAVDAGVLKGPRAAQVADLDNRAYQALGLARVAYRTGNAPTYSSALDNARAVIAQGLALVKGPAR